MLARAPAARFWFLFLGCVPRAFSLQLLFIEEFVTPRVGVLQAGGALTLHLGH